jgi:hypothetical protein
MSTRGETIANNALAVCDYEFGGENVALWLRPHGHLVGKLERLTAQHKAHGQETDIWTAWTFFPVRNVPILVLECEWKEPHTDLAVLFPLDEPQARLAVPFIMGRENVSLVFWHQSAKETYLSPPTDREVPSMVVPVPPLDSLIYEALRAQVFTNGELDELRAKVVPHEGT